MKQLGLHLHFNSLAALHAGPKIVQTSAVQDIKIPAMATESTQIDSVTSSVEASIVDVDDGSGEGQFALSQPSVPVTVEPPVKRPKLLEVEKDCPNDTIKWIPGEHGLIPFVKDAQSGKVHSGRDQMQLTKIYSTTIVSCLAGCSNELPCTKCCTCLCHLLKAYYIEKQQLI
jgi:hypothetical protein